MKRFFLLAALSIVLFSNASAQEDKRNVMLNAESASAPRVINFGLPDSNNGAVVFIDGMKHGMGLPRSQYHWAGGNSYEKVGTIGLMEAVVQYGEYSIMVDSRTRMGSDSISGDFTGASSINGLIRFDGSLRGAFGKGWYFALGAYVNYDPTSVNAPSRTFVDQKQIYQASISHRRENSSLNMTYRFSYCGDRVDGGYSIAPFTYNGDGSISLLEGFRLGRDCYMPADETVKWMDLVTGQWRTGDMSRLDRRFLHDLNVSYFLNDVAGWDFRSYLHICYMSPSTYLKVQGAGIDEVSLTQGFSLPGGKAHEGMVQSRLAQLYNTWTLDPELRFEALKTLGTHSLKSGISIVAARQSEVSSSFRFAHTVEKNPVRVYKDGEATWGFNRNSTWFDAWKIHADLYIFDDWRPLKSLLVKSGARVRGLYNDIFSAPKLEGDTKNARVEGFNLADENLCEKHHFQKGGVDYAFSEHLSWRIAPWITLMAEGFYGMTNKATTYYRNATLPSLRPIGNALVRGGFTVENKWMDLTGLVSYITSWNNAAPVSVTKQIGGESETIPWVAQYGIGTLGFTLDGSVHFGGFSLHARVTWQNPTYKNYRNEFVFSDGSVTVIDYTGKTVTGISKWMAELDPSFTWNWLRVWASVRYYSRQYVSRTNLAYFNGHFETFAGADFRFGKHSKLSLNFVNLLFQQGAKGSIDIADTIEDAAELEGLVMAGSYIRPFTVDLSYTFSF